jgi:hypothetical protein
MLPALAITIHPPSSTADLPISSSRWPITFIPYSSPVSLSPDFTQVATHFIIDGLTCLV